jgi:hypothetical protein
MEFQFLQNTGASGGVKVEYKEDGVWVLRLSITVNFV